MIIYWPHSHSTTFLCCESRLPGLVGMILVEYYWNTRFHLVSLRLKKRERLELATRHWEHSSPCNTIVVLLQLKLNGITVEQCRTHLCSFVVVLACTCLLRAYDCIIMYHDWKKNVSSYAKATCGTVMNECRQWTIMGIPCFVLVNGNDFFDRNSPSRSLLHRFMIQLLFLFSGFVRVSQISTLEFMENQSPRGDHVPKWSFVPYSMVYTMFKHNPKSWGCVTILR